MDLIDRFVGLIHFSSRVACTTYTHTSPRVQCSRRHDLQHIKSFEKGLLEMITMENVLFAGGPEKDLMS